MLSKQLIDFLILIKKKGSITKRTQNMFRGFGYYLAMWRFRDEGLVYNNGVNNRNEKVWKLTKKGQQLAELYEKRDEIEKKIEEVMEK